MAARSDHPVIAQVQARLAAHNPAEDRTSNARPAAVAIVLRPDGDDVQVLFIKRAEYEQDPWSGQVAFPGGRHETGDPTLLDTAFRETSEEIGIQLRDKAHVLGRLDDLHSKTVQLPNLFVRPFVMTVADLPPLQLSSEVAEAFWVPMELLRRESSWLPTTVRARGLTFDVRACLFEGRVIWGMTERIISQLINLTA